MGIRKKPVSLSIEQLEDLIGNSFFVDSSSIDFQYNDAGNTITAVVLPAGVDHNSLANVASGDVHTQYALLAGRSGGQSLIGGTAASNNLTLQSTSNATRGKVISNDTLNSAKTVSSGVDLGLTTAGIFSASNNGTQLLNVGFHTGTDYSVRWGDGTKLWGFYCANATQPNRVDMWSSDNGSVIRFEDNSGSGRMTFVGSAPTLLSNTDGALDIGASSSGRPRRIHVKNQINVGFDPGNVDGVVTANKSDGSGGVIIGYQSGSLFRMVIGDYVTGNFGWYGDTSSMSNLEYRTVAGTATARFNSSGHFELLADAAPSSTTDKVIFSGYDISAGNRTLALATETAVAADVLADTTHSLIIRINGANYKWHLTAV